MGGPLESSGSNKEGRHDRVPPVSRGANEEGRQPGGAPMPRGANEEGASSEGRQQGEVSADTAARSQRC